MKLSRSIILFVVTGESTGLAHIQQKYTVRLKIGDAVAKGR